VNGIRPEAPWYAVFSILLFVTSSLLCPDISLSIYSLNLIFDGVDMLYEKRKHLKRKGCNYKINGTLWKVKHGLCLKKAVGTFVP
jgi:hypothetical protein